MKNAYLLIPDLHYNVRKEHRVNYLAEVLNVLEQILQLNSKYQSNGYHTKLVFMGDVVDGPLPNAEEAMRCQDLLTFFCEQFNEAFAVVGNHEENNNVNNPFWFLVSEINDDALSALPRPIQPQGVSPCLQIVDYIEDGNTTLCFNHFGIQPKTPKVVKGRVNIGLFHQNVGSNEICKMWGTFENVGEAAFVRPYNYCFFGHMHLAEGRYYIDDQQSCLCEWLGSCVGTNVNEVKQQQRDCSIPVILVEDGNFLRVDKNSIKRSDPKKVIDYVQLDLTVEANKQLELVKSTAVNYTVGDTLYERIKSAAALIQLDGLVSVLDNPYEQVEHEFRLGLNNAVIGSETDQSIEEEGDTDGIGYE